MTTDYLIFGEDFQTTKSEIPDEFFEELCGYIESNYQRSWDGGSYRGFEFNCGNSFIEVLGDNMLYVDTHLVFHGVFHSLDPLWQARSKGIENFNIKLTRKVFNK